MEEQVASTGGLVVLWMSQREGDLMELAGYLLVEVQLAHLQYCLLRFFKNTIVCVCVCVCVCEHWYISFLEDVQFIFCSV